MAVYVNNCLFIISIGFLFKVSAAPFHFWSPALQLGKLNLWEKLLNSGHTLKIMLSNYFRKYINGWINYSCKVIRYNFSEKNKGYRGSKSCSENCSELVKEQRVNSSSLWNLSYVRGTLNGLGINCRIKIPSNNLKKIRSYCTKKTPLIVPWFITGFVDGEGCFTIVIRKDPRNRIGWRIEANFIIGLHKRDKELLRLIQAYFSGIGRIGKERNSCCDFVVSKIDQILTHIIPFFDKYPLITQKRADYLLFKEVILMMQRKEHLTVEGLLCYYKYQGCFK